MKAIICGARPAWVAWLIIVLAGCPVWADAAGDSLSRAGSLLLTGDYDGARGLFGQVAEGDRYCAVALAGAGAADLSAGRTQQATRLFRESLALAPRLPAAHMGAGTAACLAGDFRGGMTHFREALLGGAARPAVALAAEGYAACALGLYDTALDRAQTALGTEPQLPLARHVLAAASLGRGDPQPAAELNLRDDTPRWMVGPFALPCCLLGPGTAYRQAHARDGSPHLAALVPPTAVFQPPPSERPGVPPREDFRLRTPTEGQVLTGAATVDVSVGDGLVLDHVVVLVNETFAGVSYTAPHRVSVDTRLFAAGVAELRADGLDRYGNLVRSARALVRIQNSHRTLAPEERARRQAVAELLEDWLLPRPSPVAGRQLGAHGLLMQGRGVQAVAGFESAFFFEPQAPGLRRDLLFAYDSLGLKLATAAPEIYALPRGSNTVALTFDDGPHPLITPWILDELDKGGAKATFFVLGKQAMLYPELVREIVRRGHTLGSHSYAHISYRHMTPVEREQDLVKSRLAIREACGQTVTLFRPPGGYYDAGVRASAGALGFTTVFWTCNITSFPGQKGERIAAEMARRSADGGIILLHNGEDETLDTLPHLLPELRKRGARFVTINPPGTALAWGYPTDRKEWH